MKDWIETTLKDYVEVESGFAFKSDAFVESGIPVIKIGNISNYITVKTNADSFIETKDLELYSDYVLSEGDVLIAMSGNTTCKMGRVTKEFSPSLVNQRVGWIKPINEDIDINFVYQLLISDRYQKRLWNFATATGQPNLSPRDIKRIAFFKPEKQEQTAIANILSKVDEAIEATEKSIKAAEKVKKALMQNLLTGKLKPDGTWRSVDELMITKYGYAYKEWKYCKIIDLIKEGYITKVQDGNHGESHPVSAEFVDEGIPFIMASDISNGYVDTVNCKKITKSRADKLRIGFAYKGDVLLSHKASIGYTCIVDNADPYIMLTPQVTLYRVDNTKLIPEYLMYFFQLYTFQITLEGFAKQSTRNYIGITNQKKLWIYLPDSVDKQIELVKPIIEVDKDIIKKQSKIKKLQRLKKSLMQNLLTGKICLSKEFIESFISKVNT